MKQRDDKSSLIRLKEGWGIFCVLGIVMLNYPFLHIFNKPYDFLGIPLMVLYFFIGWPISIGVIYLFSRYLVGQRSTDQSDSDSEEDSR